MIPFPGSEDLLFKILVYLIGNKKARRISIWLSVISIAIGLILLVYFLVYDPTNFDVYVSKALPFFFVIPGVVFFSFLMYLYYTRKDVLEQELDKLHQERTEITDKIERQKDLEIFNTIQLSLNQLNEYYTINKLQAKSSFNWSIMAIVLGLATIISGVWMFYMNANHNITLTLLTGVGGLLLEFIGGAYFFMYKKSLEQVNFFFAQLIKVQDTMLSIKLAEIIGQEEKEKRAQMIEKIISSLLERSLK